jgi:hypothetical protein
MLMLMLMLLLLIMIEANSETIMIVARWSCGSASRAGQRSNTRDFLQQIFDHEQEKSPM